MRTFPIIFGVFLFSVLVLVLGYLSFGIWTTLIFTAGFMGGFLLWLCFPASPAFQQIKAPFWITFALFLAHRAEEKIMGFFPAMADITGTAVPSITSMSVISLVILSVVAWLAIPYLLKRRYAFGYYLSWTFFASMGITELAHFIFPIFSGKPYGYFPGMISVVFLAPCAWWGMWRLSQQRYRKNGKALYKV